MLAPLCKFIQATKTKYLILIVGYIKSCRPGKVCVSDDISAEVYFNSLFRITPALILRMLKPLV